MKINPQTKIRHVAGEHIVIIQDAHHADLSQVIGFNSTALLVYQAMQQRDFQVCDVATLLCNTYEVDQVTATQDAINLVDHMRELHLIID